MALDFAAIAASAGAATEVEISLGDAKVTVLPQMDWKVWAIEAVQRADFREWARGSFALNSDGDDGGVQWTAADPTVGQLIEFFADYTKATGISLGK